MAKRYWLCKCGERLERTRQKCECGGKRPARRVPKHAKTLRDDSYAVYVAVAEEIHGVADESCCVCGRPRSLERRHDRDHGHLKGSVSFGKPRGLACVSCNRLMPRELTVERAELIAAYLRRVDVYYAARSRDAA